MTEMQRNCMLLAAAVLTTLPTVLPAQEPAVPPGVTRDRARTERDLVRALALGYKYGRIGIVVRTDADAETDKIGAKIEGVTPGSPGQGLGDVVRRAVGRSRAGEPQSRPGGILRPQGGRPGGEGARRLEPVAQGWGCDPVDRRAQALEPLTRDADPAVLREGRDGVDRHSAQAEAHDRGVEGAGAGDSLIPGARPAQRRRGAKRPARGAPLASARLAAAALPARLIRRRGAPAAPGRRR